MNKLPFDERTLKHAIIYENALNNELDSKNLKQTERYPDVASTLLHDPFYVPKAKKKKKKKRS